MRFATKIFAAIFALSALLAVCLTGFVYTAMKSRLVENNERQYTTLAATVADTLEQLDRTTEEAMKTSLEAVRENIEYTRQVPSNDKLRDLAGRLGVSSIDLIDAKGDFLRSTDGPIDPGFNLFSLCEEYRDLFSGRKDYERTPLQPSALHGRITKYSLLPILNRKYVVNVGFEVKFLGKTLTSAIKADKNIRSLGLFTPSGRSLGTFSREGAMTTTDVEASQNPHGAEPVRYFADRMEITRSVNSPVRYCCECRVKNLTRAGSDEFFYNLQMTVSLEELHASLGTLRRTLGLLLLISMGACALAARLITRKLVDKINQVNEKAERIMNSKDLSVRIDLEGSDEIAHMARKFDNMFESLEKAQKELVLREKDKSVALIASQVAHDIRSPLAALEVALSDTAQIPEDKRILILRATGRIKDIASNLLSRTRVAPSVGSQTNSAKREERSVQLIPNLLENLVSEKRLQYRSRLGVEIDCQMSASAYGLFSEVQPVEFKRALSNLINNSVDAIEHSGRIRVLLSGTDSEVCVVVRDSGRGIPSEALPRLGERGYTHGKPSGTGLGLYHARKTVESWGGKLEIRSKLGEGTDVLLTLRRAHAPEWCLPALDIRPPVAIVILDDDTSIHQVWQARLEVLSLGSGHASGHVDVVHFSTALELRRWVVEDGAAETLFLIDYELLGEVTNGLDLIEELGIYEKSVLVTSYFEDAQIRDRCERIGVRLIPKGMAGFVPIRFHNDRTRKPRTLVLIDDDDLVHASWKMASSESGVTVRMFHSASQFFQAKDEFALNTPIYIDSNLGEGDKGEAFAEQLHRIGFRRLYLATGHSPEQFPTMSWIRAIVGKDPQEILNRFAAGME